MLKMFFKNVYCKFEGLHFRHILETLDASRVETRAQFVFG